MTDDFVNSRPASTPLVGRASAERVIAQIIAHARRSGLDQASLAIRAGIAPESLTRLKRGGRCRLATALSLAQAAGLRWIDAGSSQRGAASLAARELSAGRRVPISGEELVDALVAGQASPGHRAHLLGFFEELPIESVHEVALESRLDYGRVAALASGLGAEGETVEWLQEMAGDGVA